MLSFPWRTNQAEPSQTRGWSIVTVYGTSGHALPEFDRFLPVQRCTQMSFTTNDARGDALRLTIERIQYEMKRMENDPAAASLLQAAQAVRHVYDFIVPETAATRALLLWDDESGRSQTVPAAVKELLVPYAQRGYRLTIV